MNKPQKISERGFAHLVLLLVLVAVVAVGGIYFNHKYKLIPNLDFAAGCQRKKCGTPPPPTPTQPAITVLSPNGGEIYQRAPGQPLQILVKWQRNWMPASSDAGVAISYKWSDFMADHSGCWTTNKNILGNDYSWGHRNSYFNRSRGFRNSHL